MRFSLVHKLASYLMVLAAVSTLWFSPEVSALTKVLSLLAILASWFVDPARLPAQRWTTGWNVATIVFFVYLAVDVMYDAPVINAGIKFLLFVLVNKLFNRFTSKDYRQAYVVSFLVLVAATTLNTGISYAASFSLFVIATVWALTLFHLRREMEENYLLRHGSQGQSEKVEVERILNSRRIVGVPFLAGTSLVAVGVLLSSVVVFVGFPRVGVGLFLGARRGGTTMVGFREKVKLGQHGTIRDNPQVAMRVTFPGGKPKRPLYWRGSVYDHYEGGEWSHSNDLAGKSQRLVLTDDIFMVMHAPGMPHQYSPAYVKKNLLRHEIYLEPLDSNVVFAADRPVALQVGRTSVGNRRIFSPALSGLGEIRAIRRGQAGMIYTAWSHPPRLSQAHLSQAGAISARDQARYSRFLQVPSRMPGRVRALARQIIAGEATVHDKVKAVQRYLRDNYRYTTTLRHKKGLEPVDEFLFENREGHCEYFASAMALLLRYAGIHTRQVNGFVAGAWNDYGNYLAVRHGDAHAWVEVLYSNTGWVTVDPTPSGGAIPAAATGLTGRLRHMVDAARLRWFRYVVEYDLSKQFALFRAMGRAFQQQGKGLGGSFVIPRQLLYGLGGAVGLALLVWAWSRYGPRIWALRGRRRILGARIHAAVSVYGRLLALLARAGHDKPPGATPLEFAAALDQRGLPGAEQVQRFTLIYYSVRYGGEDLSHARRQELSELLAAIRMRLRQET